MLPTVSVLPPRKKVPLPSMEPAVMPPSVRADMSKKPEMENRALPPVLLSENVTLLCRSALMDALPAVVCAKKSVWLLFSLPIMALPAVAVSVPPETPNSVALVLFVMLALAAVL